MAGHRFDLIPTYRTDRHSDTKAMELLLAWRPVAPRLGLGVDIPIVGEKVRFRWSPVIGVEMADYTDVVDKPGAAAKVPIEGSYSRAYAEVTAELFFGQTLKLFGNYKIRQELNRTNNTYQWIEAGATLDLDADGHLSLNATYQRGEDAPTFEDVDKFILGFGVKF